MKRTRKALLASLLIALTVSLGYALAVVPNVELMTITVFLAGYILGARLGMVIGGVSMFLHSFFNPFGTALPPLLVAQVFSFMIIPVAGALIAPSIQRMRNRLAGVLVAGLFGFLLTLFYDVMTSIGAYFISIDPSASPGLWRFVIAGVVFMAMHLVWNTGLFIVALKPILNVLSHYRDELS